MIIIFFMALTILRIYTTLLGKQEKAIKKWSYINRKIALKNGDDK